MEAHIKQVIKQLERDYDMKVLYACEAGSRAWGLSSKNSDYDVRFIYVQRKNWYLSIDQKRDTLEIPNRDPISMLLDDRLDLSGWELSKALRLYRKSNPSIFEWLSSKLVYSESYSTIEKMRQMEPSIFSPVVCFHHYLNMGKRNFRDCLHSKEPNVKKYINALKPIFSVKWIELHRTFPPIEFQALLDQFNLPDELNEAITHLIKSKLTTTEWNRDIDLDVINQYLESELRNLESRAKTMHKEIVDPTTELDQLFRDTLIEVWG
ncbi:nucleotidyltransferase domain-containing protein [Cytobacillus depressus]|uniref:Nucleotidyltransferase domain-containing protein n=1 Tax=Cytobacillus depressus TaxID=1602942 RepID=A0A6L3V4H9_9BACI|nr:nucleotidyltransferase domain-containing protein [Cytobacillus depressus]KAB2332297.1 nucleotidyltransferase domain-containing protein [Cytobacillus depressus]